jgi:exopolyphosphatase/guanosine-5'-triphosphate,3'-diphosphate pyrophosphatase
MHEIGLTVSHSSFHKHGAYILANADMPGFSRQQQTLLGTLVRVHRRKFVDSEFDMLPARDREPARRLAVLLRLAALVHRGRSGSHKPPMKVTAEGNEIRIQFAEVWLSEHPLTEAEIARESEYLSSAGFTLQYA